MRRRRFLATAGASASTVGLAGCLGFGDANPDVALAEPDREYESSDVPYPAWGERIPDVSLPSPIDGTTVRLRDVSKPSVMTFFYSHCNTVCPVLISALRNVQTHATNEGYDDEVAFYPTTFDPQRDDAGRLRTYGEEMNVDVDADNWHFLRPETKDRAKEVVQEQFGVTFQRTEPDNMDMYMFAHAALTLLVNADGYVERAYRSKSPDPQRIIDDLAKVR
jgi:protein SCO1/2